MKTVNLEEIFRKHNKTGFWQKETVDNIVSAMREACNQAIELAAENANIEARVYSVDGSYLADNLGQEVCTEIPTDYIGIDKQSILNTKNQIV